MVKRFILFLLFFVVFLGINGEKCFSYDSPYTIKMIEQAKISDKKWENSQREVVWFLDYNNPIKNIVSFEGIEKDSYLKEKWSCQQDELTQSLVAANQSFLEFRKCIEEVIAAKSGDGRYADYASSAVGFDLTNWYIEFMEDKLFPHNWKELYNKDKKIKN